MAFPGVSRRLEPGLGGKFLQLPDSDHLTRAVAVKGEGAACEGQPEGGKGKTLLGLPVGEPLKSSWGC